MVSFSYSNFDLLLVPHGDGYQARVIASPVGETHEHFKMPFTAAELRSFAWLSHRAFRHVEVVNDEEPSQPPLSPQRFGEQLYRAVFAGKVGQQLVRSYDMARAKKQGLRIRLRVDGEAPELIELPWEYLYVPTWRRFPALSDQTPIVRYLELEQPGPLLPTTAPLRILAVVANPTDVPPLQVEQEWEHLKTALAPLCEAGMVVLERLSSPTLAVLQDHLRSVEAHVLHFIGHGLFDEKEKQGILLFEDQNHTSHRVTADTLATLLHDEGLRLVFLNACEGARSGQQDSFAGLATKLVQQGIPAVLAMQFPVSDKAALALAHEFYKAIASHYPIDAAVSEARKRIKADGTGAEWGTPVLFLRSPDGYIFSAAPEVPSNTPVISWRAPGVGWLAIGVAGVTLLVGLGQMLLLDQPALQSVIAVMVALLIFLLSFFGLRGDKTLILQSSAAISKHLWAQASMVSLFVLSLGLWGWLGWAQWRALSCGPLGCAPPGIQRFAIGPWANLTTGASLYEGIWITDTRNVLYDKLSLVEQLKPVGTANNTDLLSPEIIASLEVWIEGNYRKVNDVTTLSAALVKNNTDRAAVTVKNTVDERAADVGDKILALQNQLVEKILAALDIEVSAAVAEAIRNTPTNNPQALLLNQAGIALYEHQDFQGADKLFQQAIDLDAAYADPHNNRGLMRYFLRDYAGAQQSLQEAIKLSPRNPIYHYNLGLALEGNQAFAEAVEAYGAALRLDPAYVVAWNNLGYTYLLMGDLAQAERTVKHGLTLAPNYRTLYKNLGRVYLAQGKTAEAARALQRSIDLSPQNIYLEAFYYLALANQQLGERAAACTALQKYQEHTQPTTDPDELSQRAAVRHLLTELPCP